MECPNCSKRDITFRPWVGPPAPIHYQCRTCEHEWDFDTLSGSNRPTDLAALESSADQILPTAELRPLTSQMTVLSSGQEFYADVLGLSVESNGTIVGKFFPQAGIFQDSNGITKKVSDDGAVLDDQGLTIGRIKRVSPW